MHTIKTYVRQGSGHYFGDGLYAEFRSIDENGEVHDRYEPVDPENLDGEFARLQAQFGPVLGDIRLERLVTEE